VAEDTRTPVASTSGTPETSKPPEQVMDKPEPINKVVNMPPKETSDKRNSPKPINQVLSAILLTRAQREERLRK